MDRESGSQGWVHCNILKQKAVMYITGVLHTYTYIVDTYNICTSICIYTYINTCILYNVCILPWLLPQIPSTMYICRSGPAAVPLLGQHGGSY